MHATQSASVIAKSINCFKWFLADNGSDMQPANASPLKEELCGNVVSSKVMF